MAAILQASSFDAPTNDILNEGRQFPGLFARWAALLTHLVSLNWWFNQSQEIVYFDLSLAPRELHTDRKYEKYFSWHRLKAGEIERLDFHMCAPTGFVIDKCIKPSAIKHQAPSAFGSARWRTNRLQYLIRLTDTGTQVSRHTRDSLFTKLQPQRCNPTIATLQSAKTMVWDSSEDINI